MYSNPYNNTNFFEFFLQAFWRMIGFIKGDLSYNSLVSDEVQLIVLTLVSASTALVGCLLVLRKMTMLANSLSHTILIGIVVAFLITTRGSIESSHDANMTINLSAMIIASIATAFLTTFLTEFFVRILKLQEDASIGIVFTFLFALGIILVTTLTRNAHLGTEVVMGNVDALQLSDIFPIAMIFLLNGVIISLFYKEFLVSTFDPLFSSAIGISTSFFNYLLMIQVAITAIGAFRSVGVLMVLAFITVPPLTARIFTKHFSTMLLLSLMIGIGSSWIGVAFSRHILTIHDIALSTGGLVVCVMTLTFILSIFAFLFRKPNFLNKFRMTPSDELLNG